MNNEFHTQSLINKVEKDLQKKNSPTSIEDTTLAEVKDELISKLDMVQTRLIDFKEKTLDAQDDIVVGLELAWLELKEALDLAKSRYDNSKQ